MFRFGVQTRRRVAVGGLVVAVAGWGVGASASTIADARGFESPLNTTTAFGSGRLNGQSALVGNGGGTQSWIESPLNSAGDAVVQSAVVKSGTQAVRVDRAANVDTRWFVPVPAQPADRFVVVDWDQRVEQTLIGEFTFGPFFGIETFDDSGSAIGVLGTLGVDASTADVLFQAEDTGNFTETGAFVEFGEWNDFRIVLDFQADRYFGFFNGELVAETGFVDRGLGLDRFTDADLSAIAAAGDPVSQALTGTAYFDNYFVFQTDNVGVAAQQSAGDYNASGQVEQGDLDLVLQNWGDNVHTTGVPTGWLNDLPEGQIEQTELDRVLTNWGATASPDFRGSAVPEPGMMVGLLLPVLMSRRTQERY